MRFNLFFLITLFLSACAHQEVKSPLVKSPTTIVGEEYFKYPDKISATNSEVGPKNSGTCEDNQLVFLMTHPVQSMESILDYYDSSINYNSEIGSMLDYYRAWLLGVIKIDEVQEEEARVNKSIDSLEFLMNKNQEYIEKVKQLMQRYYPVCYNKMKEVYSEPKYLVQGETCTLAQNQIYIEDPFRVRDTAAKGIVSEIRIRQTFFRIITTIGQEKKINSSNEKILGLIEQYRQEIKEQKLIEDSVSNREAFEMAYGLTMGYQKSCEEGARKRSKNHK